MELVYNWKQAWKWFSVHCMTLASAVQGMWLMMPDQMKATIPPNLVFVLTIVLMVSGVVGRLVKQENTHVG